MHMTHNDTPLPAVDNLALELFVERRGAPRGRYSKKLTAALRCFLSKLATVPVYLRCGRVYTWSGQENQEVRLMEETEMKVAKLYRRGLIERRGERLYPTAAGRAEMSK